MRVKLRISKISIGVKKNYEIVQIVVSATHGTGDGGRGAISSYEIYID